ncbi:MAG TPA: gamma-glutamyl-gamma-aminobutyrate hydrolase family protein [Solirubrobacteraceae bacterium]|nr:gamma-glutamyl-gamma-aminobutyrate hydrolase family protein [Solirubrobacteraceae bacterium]
MIGLSVSMHDFGDYGGVGVQRPLYAAGGLPLAFPQLPEAVPELLDHVDAVVLAPGRDIDPARYGQAPDPLLAPIDPRRDEFEFALTPAALERGLPILGVCRGMQVLNVALGGTMVQDVRLADGWREHPSDPGWQRWKRMETVALGEEDQVPEHPRHAIRIASPSRLGDALGAAEATVNSFHHQALGELGEGLRATAVAPDGVVEAVELDGEGWVLGVQWELQEEWRIDARFSGVFARFVAAAAEHAGAAMSPGFA